VKEDDGGRGKENKRYCERSIEMYVMAERTKNGSR
jgi:hypothetical protein